MAEVLDAHRQAEKCFMMIPRCAPRYAKIDR